MKHTRIKPSTEFVCSSNDNTDKLTTIIENIKTKVYIMSCFGRTRTITKEKYNDLMNRGCEPFLKIIEV